MNGKRKPPAPIIDNLDHIDNPFRVKSFSAQPYIYSPGVDFDHDFEYAVRVCLLVTYINISGGFRKL